QRLVRASSYVSQCLRWLGELEQARELGQRNVAMAQALGDRDLQITATTYLAVIHSGLGDYRPASELLRWILDLLKDDPQRRYSGMAGLPSVFSHMSLARSLAELGQFTLAALHGDEALRIAETSGQPFDLAMACLGLGIVRLIQGDLPAAIAVLERARELCRTWDFPSTLTWALPDLGAAYTRSGRVIEALAVLEEALARAASQGVVLLESLRLVYLAEARLAAGQRDLARAVAERALEHAREHTERGNEARALHLLGEIAAQEDHPDVATAEAHYRAAITLASELGMHPLVAHCALGLGQLYHRTGDRAKADEYLTIAGTMYREMDIGFWLPQAEAALGREIGTRSQPG